MCFFFFVVLFFLLPTVFIPKPKVSQPGEVRREYEEEINKVRDPADSIRFFMYIGDLILEISIVSGRNNTPYSLSRAVI